MSLWQYRNLLLILLILLFGLWLASGFFTVQPGEQAALRFFGKFSSTAGPGLHWFYPSPIGQKDIVATDAIRRLELGFRGNNPIPIESLMITGDENIVDAQLLVQYDIKNLEQFLYKVIDPSGKTMMDVAETSLRQVVGSKPIDDVLTTEKEAVQSETKTLMQKLLDQYESGIRVREVKLQNVQPPQQVQDAFDDVVRAREDKERLAFEAEAYANDVVPRARGDAARMIQEAEAYKQRVIADSEGEAARFEKLLVEYQKAPQVTRERLYIEAIETVYGNSNKVLLDSEASGNLMYLPIDKLLENNKRQEEKTNSGGMPLSQSSQNQNDRSSDSTRFRGRNRE